MKQPTSTLKPTERPLSAMAAAERQCSAFILAYMKAHEDWHADPHEALMTTWNSAVLVVFAVAYLRTVSITRLTRATGFPIQFVRYVIWMFGCANWWSSHPFAHLTSTLDQCKDDPKEVNDALLCVQEGALKIIAPHWSSRLHQARGSVLFGGALEATDQYTPDE